MFRNQYNNKKSGFTLIEIMIVIAIIGIIVAIAIPGFLRARLESQAGACIENQTKVEGAVLRYSLEFNTSRVATLEELVGLTLYLQSTPICPTTGEQVRAANEGSGTIDQASNTNLVPCPTNIPRHLRN